MSSDFIVYDVDRDQVVEMQKDTSRLGGPEAGVTQRSTIDGEKGEIFMFSGLQRAMEKISGPLANTNSNNTTAAVTALPALDHMAKSNALWIYSHHQRKWTRVYNSTQETRGSQDEPVPRFAHQIAYDPVSRTHYLFGGNPGEPSAPRRRLNDFWQLTLHRPLDSAKVLRRHTFSLRRQQFLEMCLERPQGTPASPSMVNAMRFLQTEVACSVDHSDPEESREFRGLSSWLLRVPLGMGRGERLNVFHEIVASLPRTMQPPTANISDLIL